MFTESATSKETSSTSQPEKEKPKLQTMKRFSKDSNSKTSSSTDSNLSEAANTDSKKSNPESKQDVQSGQPSQRPQSGGVQRPPGSVPRTSRPSSARNLSSMLTKEAKIFETSNASGIIFFSHYLFMI